MRLNPDNKWYAWLGNLVNVLTAIGFFGAFVGWLATHGSAREYAGWAAFGSGFLLLGLLLGTGLFLLRFGRITRGYRWLSAEYTYAISPENPRHHICRDVITIKALRDDIHIFEDRYQWTGTGTEQIPVTEDPVHHIVLTPPRPSEGLVKYHDYRYFFVALIPALDKNQVATIALTQKLIDESQTFDNHFGKLVSESLELLKIKVILPRGTHVRKLILEHRRGGKDGRRLSTVEQRADSPGGLTYYDQETGKIEWTIKRPRLRHYYRVYWELASDPPPKKANKSAQA